MPFPPPKGLKVSLKPATPTPMTIADIKRQLGNIGLSCAQVSDSNVQDWITYVTSQLPSGQTQAFAIKTTANPAKLAAKFAAAKDVTSVAARLPELEETAIANWTLDTSGGDGYGPQLEIIAYPAHFGWLYDNRATNGFTGTKDDPPSYTGNYPNAAAIQQLFISVGITASATLIKGLDKDAMTAALTNVIQPLANANLENYDATDSRLFFVVENYNSSTKTADALGFVFVNWELKISEWKRKSKDGGDTHPTVLTIHAGSATYNDPSVLCADYNKVVKQFGLTDAPTCS
jgi:hypothetical protein